MTRPAHTGIEELCEVDPVVENGVREDHDTPLYPYRQVALSLVVADSVTDVVYFEREPLGLRPDRTGGTVSA